MPFAYYGAKHNLAPKYPRPAHPVVVEPFAGSAAYSVHHAARIERAILLDRDPQIVELWHRLQAMTPADLDSIDRHLEEDIRTVEPLIAGIAGSTTMAAALAGTSRAITPWMRSYWPNVKARIAATLPHLERWTITEGSYHDAPDIEATWHIDPPYQPLISGAGDWYRYGADAIDYAELGAWCRSRRGLVMVCEQSPAAWLPFWPLARQANGAGTSNSTRVEVIWRNDLEQTALF